MPGDNNSNRISLDDSRHGRVYKYFRGIENPRLVGMIRYTMYRIRY